MHKLLGLLCSPFATQGRSYKGPRCPVRWERASPRSRRRSGWHRLCRCSRV